MPSFTLTITAVSGPNRTVTMTTSIDSVVHTLANMPVEDAAACRTLIQQFLIDYYRGIQAVAKSTQVAAALTSLINQPITVNF